MHLLSEKQEDEFLTNVQQLEETLGTRNYDVWLCSKCGKTIIYAYEEKSSYKDCPKCKAKTYKLESEQIIHTHSLTGKDILRKTIFAKTAVIDIVKTHLWIIHLHFSQVEPLQVV